MSEIITALTDLIKFQVFESVSTGNKTRDMIICGFLMSVVAWFFNIFNSKNIAVFIKTKLKKKPLADTTIFEYYKEWSNQNYSNFSWVTWLANKHNNYEERLFTYLTHSNTIKLNISGCFNEDTNQFDNSLPAHRSIISVIRESLTTSKSYPIYIDSKGIVVIYKSEYEGVKIGYNNRESFENFHNIIMSIPITKTEDKNSKKEIKILNEQGLNVGTVYENRSFDYFVSRHKKLLMTAVDQFLKQETFGGFGMYNLGIMVYGLPGTGKTFLVKALALYLKRDIKIVDMRKIKTRAQFEKLFENEYTNYVYYFDEFDCVKGIISNRSNEAENKETDKSEKQMLQDKYLEVLNLTTKHSSSQESETYNNLLKQIERQIDEYNNALSLDTFLTVLDGVCEMRGRVIVASTNHLEKIDPALLRSGRFDLKIELGRFNQDEIRELLRLMFGNLNKEELELINKTTFTEKYTPAELIQIVLLNKSLSVVLEKLQAKI